MTIVLRDKRSGEYAALNGWSPARSDAAVFPTLVQAQSFCSHVSDRAVDAIVERPNGKAYSIAMVDAD
jgi:hypothetical protein